jgi:hypothetical protein
VTPVLLAELVAAVPAATDISMCHAAETGLATSVTATPAERGNRQRDAVLVVGQDRMQVKVERSLGDLYELAEEPVDGLPPRDAHRLADSVRRRA